MNEVSEVELQWGGRFASEPDRALLAFGSSLRDDLAVAPFDVRVSQAHVASLAGGGVISVADAAALDAALRTVAEEVASGTFAAWAVERDFEDVHGAIDARVREVAGTAGDRLHSGRSRNDQVATTMLLFARSAAADAARACLDTAALAADRAGEELEHGTLFAATTHWQPAQPMLLAMWIDAVASSFVRAARRFARVAADASRSMPLGSAALAGSSLPLDRARGRDDARLRRAVVERARCDRRSRRAARSDRCLRARRAERIASERRARAVGDAGVRIRARRRRGLDRLEPDAAETESRPVRAGARERRNADRDRRRRARDRQGRRALVPPRSAGDQSARDSRSAARVRCDRRVPPRVRVTCTSCATR